MNMTTDYRTSRIGHKARTRMSLRRMRLATVSLIVAVSGLVPPVIESSPVAASALPSTGADSSHNVAYVFDDSIFPCGGDSSYCGMHDGGGASIFSKAFGNSLHGSGNTDTYTPNGGAQVALTNVPISALDANQAALKGYDTAILYQTCTIGAPANTNAMNQINAFLKNGGKVLIFDADGCAPAEDGGKGEADWSNFMFPFESDDPGPQGASGSYNTVEPSTLTTGLSVGQQAGDSIGDANIFTTHDGNWFQAITATNTNKVSGIVEAYALAPSGGLAIYSGEDYWAASGGKHLQQVFDNALNQRWNPSNLPESISASGITLSPKSQSIDHHATVRVTATVKDASGNTVQGVRVAFKTTSGHNNCDKTSNTVTDNGGQAVCDLTPSTGATDTIQASYTDPDGETHTSNAATVRNTVVCPDYDFLGARGSGESPQTRDGSGDYSIGNNLGMGAYVSTVAFDFLNNNSEKKSIQYYGVEYPAVPVQPLQTVKSTVNILGAYTHVSGIGSYDASVDKGISWVMGHMNWRTNYLGCSQTKYIIAGYSQGAQVMADTLQAIEKPGSSAYVQSYYGGHLPYIPGGNPLANIGSEATKLLSDHKISTDEGLPDFGELYGSRIAGVVLFGDPRFNGQTWWRSSDSNSSYGGSLGYRYEAPNALRGKITSYCNKGDPICGLYSYHPLLGGYLLNPGAKPSAGPHFMYNTDGQTSNAYVQLDWEINGKTRCIELGNLIVNLKDQGTCDEQQTTHE